MVDALQHCIASEVVLSPSLRMDSMAISYCRNQVAALLGSVSMVLSERNCVAFMIPRRKVRCKSGSPNAFFRIVQASSTLPMPSGGMRDTVFPVRASQSFSNRSVFEIMLSFAASLNLSLKVMKSSLGVPE